MKAVKILLNFWQASTFPDSLQRILQDICVPFKSKNKPDVQSKIRALHGLNIWIDCLEKELSGREITAISKHLPFVSLYLLHTLLDFVTSVTREKLKICSSNCETKFLAPKSEISILNWEESALCVFLALQALKKISGIAFTHLVSILTTVYFCQYVDASCKLEHCCQFEYKMVSYHSETRRLDV